MAGSAVESRPTSSVGAPRDVRPRTQSISSDRPSIASHTFLALPQSISPEAAFIASSAASQIVTNNHDGHESTWYDQNGVEPSGEAAVISPAALQLVNSFLDQLLLNFLQVAKSTSLSALRPAVSDVLKPKLAKETISNADEELREYLGGSEEEEFTDPQSPHARDWDVELAWKRARLRCMVYSSLGDLEEEDEDKYMTQENLEIGEHERTSDIISPAVAIFLTSVLEYMGELTLSVAGQAASQRLRSKIERELKDGARSPAAVAERIVVEDIDMERVALDRTLGRLWRGWKKRMRAPPGEYVSTRSLSISHAGSLYDRKSSISERGTDSAEVQDDARDAVEEDVHPMNIPLPMGENDIAEIEVPGLAHYSDDEDEADEEEEKDFDKRRVKSFAGASSLLNESQISADSEHYATLLSLHRRSTSLPTPRRSVFYATARPRSKTADAAGNGIPELQELARLSVTEVEAKAAPAKSRDSDESGSDEFDEVIYEKAEILTSSRVSVSSTSSRSVSDTGKAIHLSRSSSVHSARIIDVPPRSPATSRPRSMESAERPRASTVSGASPLSRPGGADEMRKAKAIDTGSRTGVPLTAVRSPVERMRPPIPNAATISESEEDADQVNPIVKPVPASRTRDQLGRLPHGLQTNIRAADRISASPQSDQPHSGTRSSSLKTAQSATDTQFSDVPYRSGGHSNRTKGRPTAELDEEETTPSLHSIAPPRQIHTSGSSSSSGASRFKAVRTTSDDASNRAENMARNFEELIQSNQTITYTLTPENMRDIDIKKSADSPVVTKITRKSEDLMRSSPVGSNASQSIPRAQPASPKASSENTTRLSGPVPRAPAGAYGASGRAGGPQARDARAPGESLADFAEFIKSTGPAGDRGPAALRNVHVPVNPPKTIPESQPVTTMSSRSTNNRNRYQAREPAASSRNDNSDLIDFIRQGPASAAGSQNHIPRHVAPFRNPGDSEMMYGAAGGKAIDPVLPDLRHSQASTSVTDYSMPSMHSSVNSNSALLKNKSMPKANALFGEDDEDMGMPMPVRKTRRVRDPYAIDFSDEEEDDFDVAPRPPPKKEESLAEFLLNCEPPPEPPSPPTKQQPRRKSSTPGLMGRFGRNNSKEVNTLHESQSRPGTMGLGNEARPSNTRKHVPIQMPPGYDAYGPIDAHPPVNKAPVERAPMNRVPMKKFEPREPAFLGQTGDLARFLRDSEPPPDFNPTPVPVQQDEPSGFAKFFGRRRKASVV
ncbi:uncharacterized protein TrAFT101_003539 [Trichoderma asperellum]|uniref:Flo11 n=1 Tax=Trichoderma asperellum (strain ATCC 204424 / CBS 433.97 / NBRC 101777) TaxID=1042311 RepID=A0A2T3ZQG9_TRIA4|nr:hypothetical protein M441DRAFT_129042 [Trichoderma asperellum CBS 433.97]PTB47024.1 hypothetical protein M441DRAFT_129042 [Trichoderma asperellum CBS 433.97]UKZ87763.1 hypothetical protein TrAFT101_003539 [Trichoderma asperellum]